MTWIFLNSDIVDILLSYLPPLEDAGTTLSHRRNKGLLLNVQDRTTVRKLNLEFFNSGVNDGIPSSVVREAVFLRGRLAAHPHIVFMSNLMAPSTNEVRMTYMYHRSNLRQIMSQGPIATTTVRDILHQILRGITFAHKNNIVHRNIRPENIFIEPSQEGVLTVRIGDWTQARSVCSDPRCPSTPEESKNRPQTDKERARLGYRAPEVLLRLDSSGFQVDVWSIGVVFFELLLAPSPLPWSNCGSESELLFSILESLGTPREWVEGSLSWQVRTAPRYPCPDMASIARRSNYLLSEQNMWERIKIHHGAFSLILVSDMLRVESDRRPSASECLTSPFVLGLPEDRRILEKVLTRQGSPSARLDASPEIHAVIRESGRARVGIPRIEWVGGWLFKLARLMDVPTSKPVHVAVDLVEHLVAIMPRNINIWGLMVGCLKLATRFISSKDMFKQVNCADIVLACNGSVSENDIIESERFAMNHIDGLTELFHASLIDRIEMITENKRVCYLAQYIADLCLGDERFPVGPTETACVILACQWLDLDARSALLRERVRYPIDAVQISLSACASLLTERKSNIASFDDGNVLKVIEWNYRSLDGAGSIVPQRSPDKWITSRSYLEDVFCSDRSVERRLSSYSTPPKPLLLRRSTIEHVQEWAIESRRRKRSLSLTPVRVKRVCPSPFKSTDNSENHSPTNVIQVKLPPKDTLPETPRRSARLSARRRLTINN